MLGRLPGALYRKTPLMRRCAMLRRYAMFFSPMFSSRRMVAAARTRLAVGALALFSAVTIALLIALLSGSLSSYAVQAPKVKLDMDGSTTTYTPSVGNAFAGLPDAPSQSTAI